MNYTVVYDILECPPSYWPAFLLLIFTAMPWVIGIIARKKFSGRALNAYVFIFIFLAIWIAQILYLVDAYRHDTVLLENVKNDKLLVTEGDVETVSRTPVHTFTVGGIPFTVGSGIAFSLNRCNTYIEQFDDRDLKVKNKARVTYSDDSRLSDYNSANSRITKLEVYKNPTPSK